MTDKPKTFVADDGTVFDKKSKWRRHQRASARDFERRRSHFERRWLLATRAAASTRPRRVAAATAPRRRRDRATSPPRPRRDAAATVAAPQVRTQLHVQEQEGRKARQGARKDRRPAVRHGRLRGLRAFGPGPLRPGPGRPADELQGLPRRVVRVGLRPKLHGLHVLPLLQAAPDARLQGLRVLAVRSPRGILRGRIAATRIFLGDESRRRRGRDADIQWRRVVATPRPRRG